MRVNENKIWRIMARINDEVIVKQSHSVERAIRSVRNAVCQRICDSTGIEYELGWWKGSRHKSRRDFVDLFIGKPLYVLIDERHEIDLHDIPYEVYTVQQVQETFRKMTLMTPENIDAWGFLHWGSGQDEKFQLLGQNIPIPEHMTASKGSEQEEVIAISDAQTCIDKCPNCNEELPFGTLLIITENFRLLPTQCCSKMIWTKENQEEYNEGWA
jgi:hypothetical protein